MITVYLLLLFIYRLNQTTMNAPYSSPYSRYFFLIFIAPTPVLFSTNGLFFCRQIRLLIL